MKKKSFSEVEFEKLVENAFDFLERSLKQIKKEPKFSVINYYSAIELFFKARLLREHWTLILTDPARSEKSRFLQGDFLSVSLKQCHDRIVKICDFNGLSDEELKTFERIKEHRNRLVHFYNKKYSPPDKATIDSIIIEQFRGWLILHNLLTVKWEKFFYSYQSKIDEVEKLLHVHKEFLAKKYKMLEGKIKEEETNGTRYTNCSSCGFHSSRGKPHDFIIHYSCLVCMAKEKRLLFFCQHCGEKAEISPENKFECPNCEEEIEEEYLLEGYTPFKGYKPKELDFSPNYICSWCMEQTRIIKSDYDEYFCLGCKQIFDDYHTCEWCGTINLGEIRLESFWTGCSICEGQDGYLKDRDR